MINALFQQSPADLLLGNRVSVHIEPLLSSKKTENKNLIIPNRPLVAPQGRKQFREVLESQHEVEAQSSKQLNPGPTIGKAMRAAKLAESKARQGTTNRLPSSLNSKNREADDEPDRKSLGNARATQQSEEIEPFAEQKQMDRGSDATLKMDKQAPTFASPPNLDTTGIKPDPIDGEFIDDLSALPSFSCAPAAESGVGRLGGIPFPGSQSPHPETEVTVQGITSTLSGCAKSSEPARARLSNDLGVSAPFRTPFSKASIPLSNNLDSIFQVRVDVLKPIESTSDLLYMRNHLPQNSSEALLGQNKQEPNLVDSSIDAIGSAIRPAQFDPSLSVLSRIPQIEQEYQDLDLLKGDAKESGLVEETANTSQGALEKVGGPSTATNNSITFDHKSKAPSTSTAMPVVESTPLSKRNISQLVLRVGEDKESTLAVRLNMHGAGLRMDVLGGDAGLRDSLLGGLPNLEKTLERQAKEGGWRVTANSPPVDSHSMKQASTTSWQGETDGSQQEDVSRRNGQGEPQHRRKDGKKGQFTFTRETGNYK